MAKILVVEDSPIDMASIEDILIGMGHTVVKAEDGEKGIEMATSENPDLIVLDVVLPGMNGFQVCRTLKSDEATENLKVIMLTTKDQDSDKFWGMKQGADEYLTKPVDADGLKESISKFI